MPRNYREVVRGPRIFRTDLQNEAARAMPRRDTGRTLILLSLLQLFLCSVFGFLRGEKCVDRSSRDTADIQTPFCMCLVFAANNVSRHSNESFDELSAVTFGIAACKFSGSLCTMSRDHTTSTVSRSREEWGEPIAYRFNSGTQSVCAFVRCSLMPLKSQS